MIKKFTPEETAAWFASLEKRMSSSAVAIHDENDQVLVVKANYKHYWSFPGGIIDAGETPLDAGLREVHEEVGLDFDKEGVVFRFVVDRISKLAQTYQFVFDTEVESTLFDNIEIDTDELDEFALVSRQQILDGDRPYSESTRRWAEGYTGYAEQRFSTERPS